LDVSPNDSLKTLYCGSNHLTYLNVSLNKALNYLECGYNQLTGLDLSSNVAIASLFCSNNQLNELDLSSNAALSYLDCNSNQLRDLKMMNNFNQNNYIYIITINNPELICIQMNNAFYSSENWNYSIDPWTSFSETCTVGTDDLSEYDVHIFPNPSNGIFTISGLPLDILSVDIHNLLGEEVCSNIKRANQTTYDIDISNSPKGMYIVNIYYGKKICSKKIEIK
jgi:hypothetical protein